MTFKVVGFKGEGGFDYTPDHADLWYNPHMRLWEVTPANKDGDLVGATEYVYGKANAIARRDEMDAEIKAMA